MLPNARSDAVIPGVGLRYRVTGWVCQWLGDRRRAQGAGRRAQGAGRASTQA
ncbi:hypothetical protein [Thiolapillus sp.]|uniref:hypothetical protein n=1 Tax=Thiolapillus sp. TaxID=2017437 RepID=UPI003AF86C5F